MWKAVAIGLVASAIISSPASAHRKHHRHHHHHHVKRVDSNGNFIRKIKRFFDASAGRVTSSAGAVAWVKPEHVEKFQSYIDDLEAHGANILFMGGWRKGRCSDGHQHPCGKAVDVCQYKRDVVEAKCKLPGRYLMGKLARKNGLYEGGQWCDGDIGHVQVSDSAPRCPNKTYADRREALEEAAVYSIAEGGPGLEARESRADSNVSARKRRHHHAHRYHRRAA